MPKPAEITIYPTGDAYIPGVASIPYSGPPDTTVTSTDGRETYTLAELLAFTPAAFTTEPPPAETGPAEQEV